MEEKENAVVVEEEKVVEQEKVEPKVEEEEKEEKVEFDDNEEDEEEEKENNSEEKDDESQNNNAEPSKSKEEDSQSSEKKQSKRADKRFAELRKQAEKEKEEVRKKAYNEGIRLGLGNINPYTKEKMTDDDDLADYLVMRDMEEKGFDPLTDSFKYQRFLKKQEQEKIEQEKQAELEKEKLEKDAEQEALKDITDFKAKYPKVDVAALTKDEDFMDYADGKFGRKSFTEIYENYVTKYKIKTSKEAEEIAKRAIQRNQSSVKVSSGSGNDIVDTDYANMSDKDFNKVLEKALRGELRKE